MRDEEAAEIGRSTGEAAAAEMAEHMAPTVGRHDGVPGLGTAVEAHDECIARSGGVEIGQQPLALVAEIGADDDGGGGHCRPPEGACRRRLSQPPATIALGYSRTTPAPCTAAGPSAPIARRTTSAVEADQLPA